MKKILSATGIILLLAAAVAVFTSTGKEQCKKYVENKLTPGSYTNLQVSEVPVKFLGAKIFATYVVSYYKPSGLSLQQQQAGINGAPPSAALATLRAMGGMVTEKYLGLFNTFWKL
jgi:hypothetical protein